MLDFAAQHPGHQLRAVAYAQHGNAQIEYGRIVMRRFLQIDAVRAAGEYDALAVRARDFLERRGVGHDFTVDVLIAHAARNQLVILPAKVQHDDFFGRRQCCVPPS